MGTAAFFLGFATFLAFGIPIALALALACAVFLAVTGNLDLLAAFPRYMVAGLDQFVLISIPLFVLAGSLMSSGGMTAGLLKLSRAMIGRVPGSLSQVAVVGSMFFGGVMGSASAEAAAIGSVLIPAMEKEGYPKPYAAGLIAVAAVMGPIIPPSLAMIIYGVLSGTSISALFIAGIIPGVMIGLFLMIYAYWQARRHKYPIAEPMPWSERWDAILKGIPATLMPFIIVVGISSGIFSATESAAVAVVYALALAAVQRTLNAETIYLALRDTGFVTAGIMIVIATSNMVAFVFAMEGLPQKIAAAILAVTSDKYVILLLINVLLLILGMFLDLVAILILTLPIILPIGHQIGIDPVHLGMIVVLNVVIGLVTPPVGMCLFVTSAVARLSIEQVSRAALPMIGICLLVLLLVTYVPAISLWLPSILAR
jgi:tripartite ATP-independent transporter DctM subunit